MSDALSALLVSTAKSVRPPPKLSYSVWSEENVRLPAETSATPGRYRPWRFQKILLDLFGDPLIEQVSVPKGARVGYSRTLVAAIAAAAATDPAPIILLTPTDDDARGMMVDEIDPTFRDSPALRGLMRIGRFDGRNTLVQRALLGGASLKSLSARSPRNLRRHSARYLFCDEVDAMEITAEGDPIKLAIKRTQSFADRKIVLGSTPTDEQTSIVWRNWLNSDQGVFEVKCPHCSEHFELLWEYIKYEAADLDAAHAACPVNGCIIEERYKPQMVENGRRRALKPEVKGHAGFRINALVSLQPNASWAKLAQEYEQARKAGPSELQVFWNTVLGLPWSSAVGHVDENVLMSRREEFGLRYDPAASAWTVMFPPDVLYITAGCDVQVDRIEVVLIGHSRSGERWLLGHEVVRGSYNVETTWDDLDSLLLTKWRHPLGGEIGIEASAIDAGDGNITQQVLNFCGPRMGRKVVAIKGRQGPIKVIEASKTKRDRRAGAPLHIVGVDQVKTDLLVSLSREMGKVGAFRFSRFLDEQFFVQLTAERRVVQYPRGRPTVVFERIGYRQAEALDATTYGIAVRNLCRFDFDRREIELSAKAPLPRKSLADAARRLNGMN